jgi:hypothetical protein
MGMQRRQRPQARKGEVMTDILEQALSAEVVRGMLDYDPQTGALRWKMRGPETFKNFGKYTAAQTCKRWNSANAGKPAGNINQNGAVYIRISNKRYLAHRIIWLLVTGSWPLEEIDHIDRNPSNNTWPNLRCATRSENGCNRRLHRNNTTGFRGVRFDKRKKQYFSSINVRRKNFFLGTFETPEEAYETYCVAAKKYHGTFSAIATSKDPLPLPPKEEQ